MKSAVREVKNEDEELNMDSFTELFSSFHGYILSREELMSYIKNGSLHSEEGSMRYESYRNEKHPFPVKKTPLKKSETDEEDKPISE